MDDNEKELEQKFHERVTAVGFKRALAEALPKDLCADCQGVQNLFNHVGHPWRLKAERDAWREAFEILATGKDGSKR